jgi:hypothetical protein
VGESQLQPTRSHCTSAGVAVARSRAAIDWTLAVLVELGADGSGASSSGAARGAGSRGRAGRRCGGAAAAAAAVSEGRPRGCAGWAQRILAIDCISNGASGPQGPRVGGRFNG